MHVIAAMHNDPPGGLPIVETMEDVARSSSGWFNYFVMVYFHICKRCGSLNGHSQGT